MNHNDWNVGSAGVSSDFVPEDRIPIKVSGVSAVAVEVSEGEEIIITTWPEKPLEAYGRR